MDSKKDVASILSRAVELHNKGDLVRAKELYEEVIALDGNNAKPRVLLGNIFYYLGENEEAEKHYVKAVETDPTHAIAYFNIALIRQERGDIEGAAEFYEKTIEKKSDYAQAYSNLGALLRDKGDMQGAFQNFKKALELNTSAEVPKAEMENILGKVQDEVKRREMVREVEELLMEGTALEEGGNLERALEFYKRAVELNQKCVISYYLIGLAYEKMGEMKLALDTYKSTLNIDSNLGFRDVTPSMVKLLERHANVYFIGLEGFSATAGEFLAQLKGKPKDVLSFREFVRNRDRPDVPKHFLRRGAEKESRGDLEGAIEEYTRAIRANPRVPVPYYMVGLALETKGDVGGATENYQKAADLDTDDFRGASWELGELLTSRMGGIQIDAAESSEIIDEFKRASRNKKTVTLGSVVRKKLGRKSLGELKEGYLLDVAGDAGRAMQKFRQAVRMDPSNVLAYIVLGLAEESGGRPVEAMSQYKRIDHLDMDGAARDIPREAVDMVNEFMSRTTSGGHKVGSVLAKYIELVARNPDKMTELLGYIEDIKLDSISSIIRGQMKGISTLESVRVIRDEEDFAVKAADEERAKVRSVAAVGADLVDLKWKYKTARNIRCVALDAVGKNVLAGSENGMVYHLDDNGNLLGKLNMDVAIVGLDISADGGFGAVALQNGFVKQIDVRSKTVIWEVDLAKGVPRSVAISQDGGVVAVGLEDTNVAKISGGKIDWMRVAKGLITKVDISADGRTIAAALGNGGLYVIADADGQTPKEHSVSINKSLRCVAVSSDGKCSAVGTDEGDVYLLDEKRSIVWKREIGQVVYGIGVSSDGNFILAGSSNGKAFLYDRSGKLLWEYSIEDNVWGADIGGDGKSVVLGCGLVFGNVYLLKSKA